MRSLKQKAASFSGINVVRFTKAQARTDQHDENHVWCLGIKSVRLLEENPLRMFNTGCNITRVNRMILDYVFLYFIFH